MLSHFTMMDQHINPSMIWATSLAEAITKATFTRGCRSNTDYLKQYASSGNAKHMDFKAFGHAMHKLGITSTFSDNDLEKFYDYSNKSNHD
jgi:hypothetical protein